MPRLIYENKIRTEAIGILLDLYESESPNFRSGLDHITQRFRPMLEMYADLIKEKKAIGKTDSDESLRNRSQVIRPLFKEYDRSLTEFLQAWKLVDIPGICNYYFMKDLVPILVEKGITENESKKSMDFIEFRFKIGADLVPPEKLKEYPINSEITALAITVPEWSILYYGRDALQEEISKQLKNYENELKKRGCREYPSRLPTHARWWFYHYIKRRKYSDLADTFPERIRQKTILTKGRYIDLTKEDFTKEPPNHEESIKRAVFNFSKLIGFKTKG